MAAMIWHNLAVIVNAWRNKDSDLCEKIGQLWL